MHKLPSAQEVFDLVVNHLFTQGRPARFDDGRCRYRMTGNLRCAVGTLIPDELYKVEFEGVGASQLIENLYERELADWTEHERLLEYLQDIHDNCREITLGAFNLTDLEAHLRAAAVRFSLEYRR